MLENISVCKYSIILSVRKLNSWNTLYNIKWFDVHLYTKIQSKRMVAYGYNMNTF